jgi:hypothetical protein
MQHQLAAADRRLEPGLVFGRCALVLEQKRRVHEIDEDAPILRRLEAPGAGLCALRMCVLVLWMSIGAPQKHCDRPLGFCVGIFMWASPIAYFHAVASRW